jgi:hypothetical protein
MRKDIDKSAKTLFHLALRLATSTSTNKLDRRNKLGTYHKKPHRELHWLESGVISEASKK